MEIGEDQDMIMEKLKALQQSFNEDSTKSEKGSKTLQVLDKDLKLAKSSCKSGDNSACLHSDSFEINTGKSHGINIDSNGSCQKKRKVSIIQHNGKKLKKIKVSTIQQEMNMTIIQIKQLNTKNTTR